MSAQHVAENAGSASGSEDELVGENPNNDQPSTSAAPKRNKKKRSKGSKATKFIDALSGKSDVPQQIVDEVMDKVKQEHGEQSEAAKEENIRLALQHLKIQDVLRGKAGLGGINKKDTGEHKARRLCNHYSLAD
jgi:glycylpeptide N-tetradecanoyltransferase